MFLINNMCIFNQGFFRLETPDHILKQRDEGKAAVLSTDFYAAQQTHLYK